MPRFSITVDLPEGARDVRVSFLIPESTLVRLPDADVSLPPRTSGEEASNSNDIDWAEHKYSWPREFWNEPDISEIVAGSGEPLQHWIRFLAEHSDQVFKMSAICNADSVRLSSPSLRGPMSGMGKRMAPMGHKHWFFDTRWNHNGSGEMEYRMRTHEVILRMRMREP